LMCFRERLMRHSEVQKMAEKPQEDFMMTKH